MFPNISGHRPERQQEHTLVKWWRRMTSMSLSVCSPQVRRRNLLNATVPLLKTLHQTSIKRTHTGLMVMGDSHFHLRPVWIAGRALRSPAMISVIAENGTSDERQQGFCSGKNDPILFWVVDFCSRGGKKISNMKGLLLLGPERTSICMR